MKMTFRNEQDGVESRIQQIGNGKYSVTLWDLDSGECLPHARHYRELNAAIDTAKLWANISPSPTITLEV